MPLASESLGDPVTNTTQSFDAWEQRTIPDFLQNEKLRLIVFRIQLCHPNTRLWTFPSIPPSPPCWSRPEKASWKPVNKEIAQQIYVYIYIHIYVNKSQAFRFFSCLQRKHIYLTLLGTNISHPKAVGKMNFLSHWWDMLAPWRVFMSIIFNRTFFVVQKNRPRSTLPLLFCCRAPGIWPAPGNWRKVTLPPIIMEVENDPKWKETNIGGTHFPLPWLWEIKNKQKFTKLSHSKSLGEFEILLKLLPFFSLRNSHRFQLQPKSTPFAWVTWSKASTGLAPSAFLWDSNQQTISHQAHQPIFPSCLSFPAMRILIASAVLAWSCTKEPTFNLLVWQLQKQNWKFTHLQPVPYSCYPSNPFPFLKPKFGCFVLKNLRGPNSETSKDLSRSWGILLHQHPHQLTSLRKKKKNKPRNGCFLFFFIRTAKQML